MLQPLKLQLHPLQPTFNHYSLMSVMFNHLLLILLLMLLLVRVYNETCISSLLVSRLATFLLFPHLLIHYPINYLLLPLVSMEILLLFQLHYFSFYQCWYPTAAFKADTSDLITRVNNVNGVSQGTFDLLEASSFERFLILNGTAVAEIPRKFRTPASYMGQMEDLLSFFKLFTTRN